jgi:hypothetical protein
LAVVLANLSVRREKRKQGIAKRLMKEAEVVVKVDLHKSLMLCNMLSSIARSVQSLSYEATVIT